MKQTSEDKTRGFTKSLQQWGCVIEVEAATDTACLVQTNHGAALCVAAVHGDETSAFRQLSQQWIRDDLDPTLNENHIVRCAVAKAARECTLRDGDVRCT